MNDIFDWKKFNFCQSSPTKCSGKSIKPLNIAVGQQQTLQKEISQAIPGKSHFATIVTGNEEEICKTLKSMSTCSCVPAVMYDKRIDYLNTCYPSLISLFMSSRMVHLAQEFFKYGMRNLASPCELLTVTRIQISAIISLTGGFSNGKIICC